MNVFIYTLCGCLRIQYFPVSYNHGRSLLANPAPEPRNGANVQSVNFANPAILIIRTDNPADQVYLANSHPRILRSSFRRPDPHTLSSAPQC